MLRLLLPLLALACPAFAAGPIWWEAETPRSTNFGPPERHGFAPANAAEARALSAGRWLGADGPRAQDLFAEYEVDVPAAGAWSFYVRKFWYHGPFRWRFNDGPWTEVRRDYALLDDVQLRLHVVANWVSLGGVDLPAGRNVLRIELLERDGAACFDAFLLTREPFLARGTLKPDETYNRAPEGWFPFEPAADTFAASAIDLRRLNGAFAGDRGRIIARGNDLVHADTGEPVRFWAVNAGLSLARLDNAAIDYHARQLAKYGVNMLRLHGLPAGGEGRGELEFDTRLRERIQYLVAALRREGIYTTLSIYFPLWVNLDGSEGWPGYDGDHPFALLFFDAKFQEAYRTWWRELLTAPNPHGPPLAQEPAVAVCELVNEDSYFFWTFVPGSRVPHEVLAPLEAAFGSWAVRRHGSLEAAFRAWGGDRRQRDDPAAGRLALPAAGDIAAAPDNLRMQDTARFLAEHQRAFFEDNARFLREDLGYGGLVYGSNWVTADARVLGPLDKWSNTVVDVMDRHGYWGTQHRGDRSAYALSVGDTYRERTALRFESEDQRPGTSFSLPLADIRYNGLPSLVTEINWTPPGRFRAEFTVLAAAYASLQNQNGFYFFAAGHPTWLGMLTKFPTQVPTVMGQFPAAALIYRTGMLDTGAVVADFTLGMDDLFRLRGGPVQAPVNLDETRLRDIPADGLVAVESGATLDPLAYYVGRVQANFAERAAPARLAPLDRFIDREARTITSSTGQILWDWGRGVLRLDAPRVAGLAGFLGNDAAGPLRVAWGRDYGTVLLVALDGVPLAESRSLLLQVMTEDANYGWRTEGDPVRRIVDLGLPPVVVREPAGTVSLALGSALRVQPLDLHGYAEGPVQEVAADASGLAAFDLRPRTLYYHITVGR